MVALAKIAGFTKAPPQYRNLYCADILDVRLVLATGSRRDFIHEALVLASAYCSCTKNISLAIDGDASIG
jgi:hypothetical protein